MSEAIPVCSIGKHPIEEDHYVTSYEVDKEGNILSETYACKDCDLERKIALYRETSRLTTNLMLESYFSQNNYQKLLGMKWDDPPSWNPKLWFGRFQASMDKINSTMKLWERAVWFGGTEPDKNPNLTEPYQGMPEFFQWKKGIQPKEGLQAFVVPAQYHGYEAKVEGITYSSYTIAGRSLFQIESPDGDYISFVMDETSPSPRGGIQGIRATEEKALQMISQSIADWQAGKMQFKHSKEMSLI